MANTVQRIQMLVIIINPLKIFLKLIIVVAEITLNSKSDTAFLNILIDLNLREGFFKNQVVKI